MVFSPYYFWFFLRRFKYTQITVMDAASIPANIPIGVLSPVFMLIFCLIHKFLLFSPLLCITTENHRSATDNLRFSYYFSIYFASTARIFFRSSSFAIWSFIPAFLAFTTSSANALAVMAMTVLSFYYHTVLWHCSLSAAFTCSISLPCFICFLYWCSSFLNPLQSSCSPLLYWTAPFSHPSQICCIFIIV